MERALQHTAALWPPIRRAFGWVHQAAHILDNDVGLKGSQVRQRLCGLLAAIARWRGQAGDLAATMAHFLKVSRSYWPGLFHCYDVEGLPRTNNDLEHVFGSHRYHERRATGRKVASPALVLRGSVRLLAALATRSSVYSAQDLACCSPTAWKAVRMTLDRRRQTRVCQHRFRRDPDAYLAGLGEQLVKLILPP